VDEVLDEPRRRQTDTSNAEARSAIRQTVAQFAEWRGDLARFMAKVERRYSDAERSDMLARCAAIEAELLEARTSLILGLADAPARVAGHSRVADVERAMDGVEAAISELRRKLAH
jgi:hypothetical protein